jgi:hypothetical protein
MARPDGPGGHRDAAGAGRRPAGRARRAVAIIRNIALRNVWCMVRVLAYKYLKPEKIQLMSWRNTKFSTKFSRITRYGVYFKVCTTCIWTRRVSRRWRPSDDRAARHARIRSYPIGVLQVVICGQFQKVGPSQFLTTRSHAELLHELVKFTRVAISTGCKPASKIYCGFDNFSRSNLE